MGNKVRSELLSIKPYYLKGIYESRFHTGYQKQLWFCTGITLTYTAANGVTRTSTITDDADSLLLPLRTRACTHSVKHLKASWSGPSVGTVPVLGWVLPNELRSTGYVGDAGLYWAAKWAPYEYQTGAPLPADDILKAERTAAFAATKPSFSSDFSLINFILELRDFSRLFKVTDAKWGLKEQVESNFLNWTFGWVPFATDLVNLHGAYLRVKNGWDHIKSNSDGNIVTTKAKSGASRTKKTVYPTAVVNYDSDVQYLIQTRYLYDVLDTSTELRSTVPDGMYVASVAQALGLCANPAIVWNALPFSFVVDWFIPISDALDKMKKDTFVPGHIVLGADLHTTTNRAWRQSGTASIPEIGGNPAAYDVSMQSRTYVRKPDMTTADFTAGPLDGLRIGGPSGYRWFVGAILGSHIFL